MRVKFLGKKSWVKKLNDSKDLPKVSEITEKMSKRWGTGTCYSCTNRSRWFDEKSTSRESDYDK
jgi:hypothetical protein